MAVETSHPTETAAFTALDPELSPPPLPPPSRSLLPVPPHVRPLQPLLRPAFPSPRGHIGVGGLEPGRQLQRSPPPAPLLQQQGMGTGNQLSGVAITEARETVSEWPQASAAAPPFASMFLAKATGPVRITSFFQAPGSATVPAAQSTAPDGREAFCNRGVRPRQLHSAIVLSNGQAAPQQQQQQRYHEQQRQLSRVVAAADCGRVLRLPRWVPECHTIPGTRYVGSVIQAGSAMPEHRSRGKHHARLLTGRAVVL